MVSAIPFFSLAYTFMLSRLTHAQVDLVELEEVLRNQQEVKKLRERYEGKEKSTLEEKAKGVIGSISRVIHAGNDAPRHAVLQEEQPAIGSVLAIQCEGNETPMRETPNVSDATTGQRNGSVLEEDSSVIGSVLAIQCEGNDLSTETTDLSDVALGERNVSLEDASEVIGVDIRIIKQLLSKGKLKAPATSDKLITRTSIESYLAKKRQRKTNGNGHAKETDPLMLPVLATSTSEGDE